MASQALGFARGIFQTQDVSHAFCDRVLQSFVGLGMLIAHDPGAELILQDARFRRRRDAAVTRGSTARTGPNVFGGVMGIGLGARSKRDRDRQSRVDDEAVSEHVVSNVIRRRSRVTIKVSSKQLGVDARNSSLLCSARNFFNSLQISETGSGLL